MDNDEAHTREIWFDLSQLIELFRKFKQMELEDDSDPKVAASRSKSDLTIEDQTFTNARIARLWIQNQIIGLGGTIPC